MIAAAGRKRGATAEMWNPWICGHCWRDILCSPQMLIHQLLNFRLLSTSQWWNTTRRWLSTCVQKVSWNRMLAHYFLHPWIHIWNTTVVWNQSSHKIRAVICTHCVTKCLHTSTGGTSQYSQIDWMRVGGVDTLSNYFTMEGLFSYSLSLRLERFITHLNK